MRGHLRRPELFRVCFDNITLEEASKRAKDMAQSSSWHYVVGTNADLLQIARKDEQYRRAINRADMSLADGYGVVCASRILGVPLVQRVPCMDLLDMLLPELSGMRIYLLGGRKGTAEKAIGHLKERYPELVFCGAHHGFFTDPEKMAKKIAQCSPDVLLVCLGSPKQELWMAKYGKITGAGLACGCGGWIDICAGDLKRAPAGWRKINLEWAYRFLQEPWRFQRVCRSLRLPLLAIWEAGKRELIRITAKGD